MIGLPVSYCCKYFTFLIVSRNVVQYVPAWRLLCSYLPVPDCCCCYSCVLPPGGRVTSRHGRPSRFNPPFQNFDQCYLFSPFSEALFCWKTSSSPKTQSSLKKGRIKNVGEGEELKFNITFQNFKIKCPFKAFVWFIWCLRGPCFAIISGISSKEKARKKVCKIHPSIPLEYF